MSAGIYIYFQNQTKEAIKFYEKVFKTKNEGIMLYKDMPADDNFPIDEKIENQVLNAAMTIHGMNVMFSDLTEGMGPKYVPGNNIALVINIDDEDLLTEEYNALAEEGIILMPLEKTFWSDKYGFVTDCFGINWHFSLGDNK